MGGAGCEAILNMPIFYTREWSIPLGSTAYIL